MRKRAIVYCSAAAAATITLCVLHEGLSLRCEVMAQRVAPAEQGRRIGEEEARRLASDAMRKYGFEVASDIVMGLMLNDIPQNARYDIMREYSEKYRALALARIRGEASAIGGRYEDMDRLPKENPNLYGYVKTLSFGMALFGERGFNAGIEMIRDGRNLRDPERPGYPLAHQIGMMAAGLVLQNRLLPPGRALETLSRGILSKAVEVPEKELFMRLAFSIEPESACRMRSGADAETRALIDHHIQTDLRGKVSCG
jgi:hypothetical protein